MEHKQHVAIRYTDRLDEAGRSVARCACAWQLFRCLVGIGPGQYRARLGYSAKRQS